MTDNGDQPSPRERLLEEWQAATRPLDEQLMQADRGALDFAVENIKNAALLNGGALVVLPAYGALFGIEPNAVFGWLFSAGLCFILGLLMAWLANIAGYFTMVYQTRRALKARAEIARELSQPLRTASAAAGQRRQSADDDNDDAQSAAELSERCRLAGIALSFLSLGAFVAGAILSGTALMVAP